MKKGIQMKQVILAAAFAALATGCISVHKNEGSNSNVQPNIARDIVHEKYEVGKTPVEATDSVKCLFKFICWGSSATHIADQLDLGRMPFGADSRAKRGAYANALDASKADSLAGVRYEVTTKDYFVYQESTAKAVGYPVKLTGVDIIPAEVRYTPVEGVPTKR